MSTIYLASSWRNEFHTAVLQELRQHHAVYDFKRPGVGKKGFAWSDIDKSWENWSTTQYVAALEHPIAVAGFNNDFEAMAASDVCVLLLPSGRSANAEAGWMKGAGKKVFVLQIIPQEPELMYKMYDGIFDSVNYLILALKRL